MVEHHYRLEVGNQAWQRAASCYIRMSVFVLERTIAMEEEFDENDLPDTVYAVIYDGKVPVSTGRYIEVDEDETRFTRIATLKEYRGKQLGRQIIEALEAYALQRGKTLITIHSEVTAQSFYEELGYRAASEVYEEDGVPAITLKKQL